MKTALRFATAATVLFLGLLCISCASNAVFARTQVMRASKQISTQELREYATQALMREGFAIESQARDGIFATFPDSDFRVALAIVPGQITLRNANATQEVSGPSIEARDYRKHTEAVVQDIETIIRQREQLISVAARERKSKLWDSTLENLSEATTPQMLKHALADYEDPQRQWAMSIPAGLDTGYEFLSYYSPDSGSLTFVFFGGHYLTHTDTDPRNAELMVFEDYSRRLFDARGISFRTLVEWRKLKWFEVNAINPSQYDTELYLYQLWQAERVDNGQSSMTEYQFQVAQKERQLREAQQGSALADQLMASANRTAEYQAEMLKLQSKSVALQREAVSLARLNAFASSYRPQASTFIHCTSTSYSTYSVSTTCN